MKKRIRYIFVLMMVCILGILAVQGFWLYNAWHIAFDQFGKSINGALGEAIGKQGFHDIQVFLRQNPAYNIEPDSIASISLNRPGSDDPRPFFFNKNGRRVDMERGHDRMQKDSLIKTDTNDSVNGEEPNMARNPSMFFISEKISQQPYNIESLDSLYAEELEARGIRTGYTLDSFRVNRSAFRDKEFREKWRQHTDLQTFKRSVNYSGSLFVQATFQTPYGYLFGKLLWILIASFLLFILITWCFIYMLQTILKQKRWSEVKNDFISNMTHELKTPIATVNAAIEALQHFDGMEDRNKSQSYLDISHHELKRLSDLVEKVLHLSVEENEELVLHKEKINVITLINEIIRSYELKAKKKVTFTINNLLEDPKLRVDNLHFSNAINNLIDNAIKYSGEKVHINITLRRKADHVLISIADNGLGISSHYQKLIFDKFFRVPTGDLHNVKGFGLGLSYVKNVIEKHEGTVQVKSEPGSGTEFIIVLPA